MIEEDSKAEDCKTPETKKTKMDVMSERTNKLSIKSPNSIGSQITESVISPGTQALIFEIKNALDIE